MATKKGLGTRLTRKEDNRFLRGKGQYTSDLDIPGTLEAVFVRSPLAHARITGIEAPPISTTRGGCSAGCEQSLTPPPEPL